MSADNDRSKRPARDTQRIDSNEKRKRSHLSAKLLTQGKNQKQIQLKNGRDRGRESRGFSFSRRDAQARLLFFCLTRHTMATQTLLFRLAPCLRLTRGEPGVVEPPGHSQASAGWQSQRESESERGKKKHCKVDCMPKGFNLQAVGFKPGTTSRPVVCTRTRWLFGEALCPVVNEHSGGGGSRNGRLRL